MGAASFLLSGCGAKEFHLSSTPVVPAASGDVKVSQDNNGNTRIDVQVKNLARPSELTPPKDVYVVWIQPAGMPPENAGELKVGNDLKASLTALTPRRNFDLLITAEQNPRTTNISGPVVMRTEIHQNQG